MKPSTTHAAQIPNPALEPFSRLIGEWESTGTHPLVPGQTIRGHASFEWMEGGAFMIEHSAMEEAQFPDGIAIFGSDDATGEFFMIYFDERKVSRKYEVAFEGNVLKWWRNTPGFSQRYTWTFSEDGNTITGQGQLNQDGTWKEDLGQVFVRVG